jgi:hypothetical protein
MCTEMGSSLNEFDCFYWMDLNDALSFTDVNQKCLRQLDVLVDDIKCSDQFCNLKTFVQHSEQ